MDIRAMLAKLRKVPERIGIDASGRGVRAVRLARRGDNTIELVSRGFVDIDTFNASSFEMHKLKAFIREIGGAVRTAAMAIEHPSLRIQRMDIPPMPERDLMEALRWNFREHIEVPMEHYSVGYTAIDITGEGDRRPLMAYGVSNEAIERHREVAAAMGCNIVALEPIATALIAVLNVNTEVQPGAFVAAVMIGDEVSYLTVMSDDTLLFSRSLASVSMDTLMKLIVRNVSVDEEVARDALDRWLGGKEGELSEEIFEGDRHQQFAMTISRFYSQLVIEVQRAIDTFCLTCGAEKLDVLYACGIGAHCPGILEHMEKTLGVQVALLDPFERIAMSPEVPHGSEPHVSTYATAVGLAIA